MVNLIVIFMAIVLVNNFVLSQFLGICSFLGVSNKMSSSVGMGGAVVFVMVIAELVTWPVMQILNKLDRKSTRLNSSHPTTSRMPSSA